MFFGKRFSSYHSDSLSGIEILVLSIIKNHNGTTGYDIIQLVKKKFGGMWHTSAGTIYPLLKRLADKDLVKIQEALENNRLKKIYFLTSQGEEELQKLDKVFTVSVASLKDYIQTIFKAIPEMRAKAEVAFCNFPYQSCHEGTNRNVELDISQQKIDRINRELRQLRRRVESINQEIKNHEDLLAKILKKREDSRRSIDIEDDFIS
ncbi:MAG: helix-turn-helix transcriptional regulator [Promethearchaeota archaeon]